jgi:hypothetical protein
VSGRKTEKIKEKMGKRAMQSLKDATVVLGVLLLLVSVKVAPLDSVGDVIPSAEAAPAQAETDGGTELAGLVGEASDASMEQMGLGAELHDCESSTVEVRALDIGTTGDRIILRIDTRDGQAQVERIDVVGPDTAPSPSNEALEASKIG